MQRHFECFTGRVGKIGDLKTFGNNGAVVNFSVAETVRKKNATTQQWEDVATTWTNVTLFGPEAQNFVTSVKPGTFVTVVGYRDSREYTPNDSTEKRTVQQVIADQVSVAITRFNTVTSTSIGNGNNGGNSGSGNNGYQSQQSAPQTQNNQQSFDTGMNQDPFANDTSGFDSGFEKDPFDLG